MKQVYKIEADKQFLHDICGSPNGMNINFDDLLEVYDTFAILILDASQIDIIRSVYTPKSIELFDKIYRWKLSRPEQIPLINDKKANIKFKALETTQILLGSEYAVDFLHLTEPDVLITRM